MTPLDIVGLCGSLRADGVLIVTPEYNFSVPGGLKTVLDWLSRGDHQPWVLKPVAIASASTGNCTDDTTRKFVTDQTAAFEHWIGGVARMKG